MSGAPGVHLASPAITPPSPQHLEQIAAARKRGKAIKRASSTAVFSGWTMAIFGASTIMFCLMDFSVAAFALGAGMCVLAHFELRGAQGIRRLNPDAAWLLARNQIIFGLLLLVYCAWSMWTSLTNPSELESALGGSGLPAGYGSTGDLVRFVSIAFYGILGFAAIVGCGGAAWYYASRKKHIEAYLRETPPWITELQRAGMSVY